jgi:GH15 family glucan-1,4-alpha-glucosidase
VREASPARAFEARQTFDRVISICNDVGLLAEEYDPGTGRFLGNFPQAFSHIGLVNTARNLCRAGGPASRRQDPTPLTDRMGAGPPPSG